MHTLHATEHAHHISFSPHLHPRAVRGRLHECFARARRDSPLLHAQDVESEGISRHHMVALAWMRARDEEPTTCSSAPGWEDRRRAQDARAGRPKLLEARLCWGPARERGGEGRQKSRRTMCARRGKRFAHCTFKTHKRMDAQGRACHEHHGEESAAGMAAAAHLRPTLAALRLLASRGRASRGRVHVRAGCRTGHARVDGRGRPARHMPPALGCQYAPDAAPLGGG